MCSCNLDICLNKISKRKVLGEIWDIFKIIIYEIGDDLSNSQKVYINYFCSEANWGASSVVWNNFHFDLDVRLVHRNCLRNLCFM